MNKMPYIRDLTEIIKERNDYSYMQRRDELQDVKKPSSHANPCRAPSSSEHVDTHYHSITAVLGQWSEVPGRGFPSTTNLSENSVKCSLLRC